MSTSDASHSASGSCSNGSRLKASRHHNIVGHTCAWTVRAHLDLLAFEDLKSFCGTDPSPTATIRRKQLEIAVRRTSRVTDRRLRLVRRGVVDATEKKAAELPVVGRVDKTYKLERPQKPGRASMGAPAGGARFRPHGVDLYETLLRLYREAKGTIHTTIACTVIKRYMRDRLGGLSLRDHGGVYFVSVKREGQLFDLAHFLSQRSIGHITHFGVGEAPHETEVLSGAIRRMTRAQIDRIRGAFQEANLSVARDRSRLRQRIQKMRGELAEMEELFGFARETLRETDAEARRLMKQVLRGACHLPEEALAGDALPEAEDAHPGADGAGAEDATAGCAVADAPAGSSPPESTGLCSPGRQAAGWQASLFTSGSPHAGP